jgi:hypothetical protein
MKAGGFPIAAINSPRCVACSPENVAEISIGSHLDDLFRIPQSAIPITLIALSPRLLIDSFFSSVPRHLPDKALRSKLAIELWIDAFTAMIDAQALATLLTESGFMFVADPNGFPVRMVLALHRPLPPAPGFRRFETGRGLRST